MDSQELDRVFGALADPVRRGILVRLSTGAQNVSQLTEAFDISQPAISRHLKVLGNAGLVEKQKRGREQLVRANAARAEQAAAWITRYSTFWRHHFDAVGDIIEQRKGAKK